MNSRTNGRLPRALIGGAIVFGLVLLGLFPIYFMVVSSLKSIGEFSSNYFLPPLKGIDWSNWVNVFPDVIGPDLNSLSIGMFTVVGLLLVATPAAYAFAWQKFPGAERLYTLAIVTILLPAFLTFVPQFVLIRQLGLLDTQPAVILPGIATSIGLALFLLRSFFRAIPFDLVEAARLDGANELQILARVILPLSVPGVITVSVMTLVTIWNGFLWPLVVLPSPANRTATVAATFLSGDSVHTLNFPLLMAGYLLCALPLILLVAPLLKFFMAGAAEGSVKG